MRTRAGNSVWLQVSLLDSLPLFVAFSGVALATAPAEYAPRDLVAIIATYFLLALTLTWQAVLVARALPGVWGLSALPAALALTWHLRETLHWPEGAVAFGLVCAALCGLLSMLARLRRHATAPLQGLLFAGASGMLLLALLLPAFHRWNNFRWHVLQHNSLLGMPLYRTQVTPTADVIKARWSQRGTGPAIRPPELFQGPRQGPPPNILFILADTLRADRLEVYGGRPELMPNANALAARSSVFTNVQANASWTRPSIASIFTGMLQEQHGAIDRGDALPPSVKTMAEHLSASGYQTVAFVTNFGAVGKAAGFAQGFEEMLELSADPGTASGYMPAEQVNREVRNWLARRTSDEPLFMYVHYLDPHEPYTRPAPKSRRYSDLIDAYDGNVQAFDSHLPELFEEVRKGLGSDPVTVFVADHGEEFGEHGGAGHGSGLSREQIAIPLLVSLPGRPAARYAEPLEGRDVFTLVGLLANGGDDLATWAKHHARPARYASVFLTTTASRLQPRLQVVGLQAYEDGEHLIRWSAYGETYELYDLARDPDLRTNLYEARRSVAGELLSFLTMPIRSGVEKTIEPSSFDERAQHALRTLGYVD